MGWVKVLAAAAMASALCSPPAFAQAEDVLAPARMGQMWCFEPDVAKKSCTAISAYSFDGNGGITSRAQVMIFSAPAIIMLVDAPVTVRDGAVCGPMRREDLATAEFTVDGVAATPEDTAAMRAQVGDQLGAMMGVELCTRLVPDGETLRADAIVNGTPRPDMAQRVIWISAEDGYAVGR